MVVGEGVWFEEIHQHKDCSDQVYAANMHLCKYHFMAHQLSSTMTIQIRVTTPFLNLYWHSKQEASKPAHKPRLNDATL